MSSQTRTQLTLAECALGAWPVQVLDEWGIAGLGEPWADLSSDSSSVTFPGQVASQGAGAFLITTLQTGQRRLLEADGRPI